MTDTPDPVALYVDALAVFGRAVQDVQDHEWDLPTPAAEWDVRQVVAHVVLGEAAVTAAVNGEDSMAGTEVDASVVGTHPMSAWRGTALKAIDSARTPDMANAVYAHASGDVVGRQLLGYRISENIVHAWDVTTATGRPVLPPEHLAEFVLAFWLPAVTELQADGAYAEPVMPGDNATAAIRLLALLGRRSA